MDGETKKMEFNFVIDCSDKRNEYLFDSLIADGYHVTKYQSGKQSKKSIFLFAPSVNLTFDIAHDIPNHSRVFCVRCESNAQQVFDKNQVAVHFYFDDELLAMKNAYLTAEGALSVIIQHTDRSVRDMRALVLGGGRVGKSVAKLLHDNRCSVFVATVDPSEYAFASIFSDGVLHFWEYQKHLSEFDLIVNTVPVQILKEESLTCIKSNCFILDLASIPGGVDFKEAERLGLKAVHALGIPGKTAPHSAAAAVKESIFRILMNIQEMKDLQRE